MTAWLLDAGVLVAYLDADDRHHGWVRQQWEAAPLPLLTCEVVLAEAAHLVARGRGKRRWVLELIERKAVRVALDLEREVESLCRLLDKYSDQPMDLADACLVRMSELYRDCRVFTTDSDFRVYRRFERQVIPLITPH